MTYKGKEYTRDKLEELLDVMTNDNHFVKLLPWCGSDKRVEVGHVMEDSKLVTIGMHEGNDLFLTLGSAIKKAGLR